MAFNIKILEHEKEWGEKYQQSILAPYQQTGQFSLKGYEFANNQTAPGGPGVSLASSRLLFISSSGAFHPQSQDPFNAESPLGDYSIREIPAETPLAKLDFAHTHYDQSAVRQDPETLLPLHLLQEKVAEGEIGSLADRWVSFMGYQPDLIRVVHETIPRILTAAAAEKAHMALLVPA
jgi:D-proline reductase (dithiol) PrdB